MKHSHIYATPLGPVLIEENDGMLSRIEVGGSLDGPDAPSALTNAFANELLEYLAGKRRIFSIPCAPSGTPFQQAAWHAVKDVPYGQVRTCTEIANIMGQPNARRQVGRAAALCPCPIIVPIHRISSLDDLLSQHLRTLESKTS